MIYCDICKADNSNIEGYTDIFGGWFEACESCRNGLKEQDAKILSDEANSKYVFEEVVGK